MELDDSIKNDLKCTSCDNYLTCTPIMVKPNGDSMCGRCSPSKEEKHLMIRNNAYEKLASAILFQCRYKTDGCDFTSAIPQLEEHEVYCLYHKFKCPVLPSGSCPWIGSRLQLNEHFQTGHPDLLITAPYDVKPNTTKNYEQNMLAVFADKLFLIQVKYNVSSAKYWHNVRLINNPNLSKHYGYNFEISSERGNFSKQCDVLEQEFFQIYDDPLNVIDINSLINLFGRLEDLTFKITLIERDDIAYCVDCKKSLLVADIQNEMCTDCNNILIIDNNLTTNIKCTKNDVGCLYNDKDDNVKKHEVWFCEFAENTCTMCDSNVADLFNHYFTLHRGDVHFDVMEMANLNINHKYSGIIISNDIMFLCLWNFTRSYLEFKIISNISKTDSADYDCVLKMINPRDKFQKKYKMVYYPNVVTYDWLANIKPNADNPILALICEQVQSKYESRTDVLSNYSFELRITNTKKAK